MHQRQAGCLGRQRQRPVERRIAAAEDHQLAAVEIGGVLDAVVNLLAFEVLGRLRRQAPRLKRADTGGDHDRAGVEHGAGAGRRPGSVRCPAGAAPRASSPRCNSAPKGLICCIRRSTSSCAPQIGSAGMS